MNIDIIGASTNLGANRIGVEKGFSTLNDRLSLKGIFSNHNITSVEEIVYPSIASYKSTDTVFKNKDAIFQGNEKLANTVLKSLKKTNFPLIIGGDHSLSWGSISGVASYSKDLGCIYIDAHGDFNPAELSPSHNVHGMHMAYLMGMCSSPYVDFYVEGVKLNKKNVFFVGTRSLDFGEKALANHYSLNIQTSNEIRKYGIEQITVNLLKQIKNSNIKKFHLSLDIDVMDPTVVPGTGVPEIDGITLNDTLYILKKILETGKIISMDLVEFNPLLDIDDKTLRVCEKILEQVNSSLR